MFTAKDFFLKAQNLKCKRPAPSPRTLLDQNRAGDSHAPKQIDPKRLLQEMFLSWLRMEDGQDGRNSQICDRVNVGIRKGRG